MKTFMDKLNEANDSDVIKQYNINSTKVKLYKYNFNSVFKLSPKQFIEWGILDKTLWCEMSRPNDSVIIVKISKPNTKECDVCEGTGEHYCDDCCDYHMCGVCRGTGEVIDKDSDELLLEDTIYLNQTELF